MIPLARRGSPGKTSPTVEINLRDGVIPATPVLDLNQIGLILARCVALTFGFGKLSELYRQAEENRDNATCSGARLWLAVADRYRSKLMGTRESQSGGFDDFDRDVPSSALLKSHKNIDRTPSAAL